MVCEALSVRFAPETLRSTAPVLAMAVLAASTSVPSLTVLSNSFGKMSGAEAQVAYAASALAAKRLLDEAGGIAIANLLRDLGDSVDFEAAFLHRIQKSFADFQASVQQR